MTSFFLTRSPYPDLLRQVVRLQISPPSLTFTREIRFSCDVVIRFTSQATGVEIVHTLGHIYLLSDLFLICEKILPENRSQVELEGADMWLCYPPLSGKVLRVSEIPELRLCLPFSSFFYIGLRKVIPS